MDLPRLVHGPEGASQVVTTLEAYTAALAAGWTAQAQPMTLMQGDETVVVYTAAALVCALEQGWTRVETAPVEPPVARGVVAPVRRSKRSG